AGTELEPDRYDSELKWITVGRVRASRSSASSTASGVSSKRGHSHAAMSALRLLLVPSFTELEWGIRTQLEQWADVATFDSPGVGDEPLPPGVDPDPRRASERASEFLSRWRDAAVERGLE